MTDEHVDAPAETGEDKQSLQREVVDFVKLVVWFLVVFVLLRTYVIEGYEVQGDSMNPNLANDERILVFKLPQTLSQWGVFGSWQPIDSGDIIVFDSPDNPNKRYVKRVVASGPKGAPAKGKVAAESGSGEDSPGGGVVVQFDRGRVYVDNRLLEEPYLTASARRSADRQKLVLGPGEYYVLGDNRAVSKDSRSFEAIRENQIIGKAVLRFWPPRRISLIQ